MIVQWRGWQARPQACCWCMWRREGDAWVCAEKYPPTLGAALVMMAPARPPAYLAEAQARAEGMRARLMADRTLPTRGAEVTWRTWRARAAGDCWVVSRMGEGGRWVDQGLYPRTLGHACELMLEREQRAGTEVTDVRDAMAASERMFSELVALLPGTCG